jgi:hypothetical protein
VGWLDSCSCLFQRVFFKPHKFAPLNVREESVFQDIQPDELHVKLQDPSFSEKAQLIDIREPQEVYAPIFFNF